MKLGSIGKERDEQSLGNLFEIEFEKVNLRNLFVISIFWKERDFFSYFRKLFIYWILSV